MYSETKRNEELCSARRTSLLLFGNRPRVSLSLSLSLPPGNGCSIPLPDSAFLRPILYPSLVHDEIFLESNPWKGNCRPRACRASIGGLRERSSIKIAVWRSWRASSKEGHSPSPLCSFLFLPIFFPLCVALSRESTRWNTDPRPELNGPHCLSLSFFLSLSRIRTISPC